MVFHDMSRERQYAARLSHLASHDALTGLLNRREFERRAEHALDERRSARRQPRAALPRPRPVQGRQRHLRPSRRRRAAAPARRAAAAAPARRRHARAPRRRRVRRAARSTARSSRRAHRREAAPRGRRASASSGGNGRSRSACSIGVVPIDAGTAHASRSVLSRGGRRLLRRPRTRAATASTSTAEDERASAGATARWMGARASSDALAENRFCLYAQPIVPLRRRRAAATDTSCCCACSTTTSAIVPPRAFIPAAERYDLMPAHRPLGGRHGVSLIAADLAAGRCATASVAINLSGASLGDEDFLRLRAQRVRAPRAFRRSRICFEITETAAITNLSTRERLHDRAARLGCRFALDDFGVGVSSFALPQAPAGRLPQDRRQLRARTC